MLWHCADFHKYFSVKVNSMTYSAKVDCQKWAIAIYLMSANLCCVFSMKLHRDIGVA